MLRVLFEKLTCSFGKKLFQKIVLLVNFAIKERSYICRNNKVSA